MLLILYISGASYSLKTTPNDKFFETQVYLLSQFLLEILLTYLISH